MEVDEESFHSAASAQGDHSPYGGQLALSSFDLESLKCTMCPLKPGNIVLYREANEKLNMHHYPAVFIISDQSYPPNIPTGGEDCEG